MDNETAQLTAEAYKVLLNRICDLTGDILHTNENVVLGVERVVKERDYWFERLYKVYREGGGILEESEFKERELEMYLLQQAIKTQ